MIKKITSLILPTLSLASLSIAFIGNRESISHVRANEQPLTLRTITIDYNHNKFPTKSGKGTFVNDLGQECAEYLCICSTEVYCGPEFTSFGAETASGYSLQIRCFGVYDIRVTLPFEIDNVESSVSMYKNEHTYSSLPFDPYYSLDEEAKSYYCSFSVSLEPMFDTQVSSVVIRYNPDNCWAANRTYSNPLTDPYN